jgi:hypothetical protein
LVTMRRLQKFLPHSSPLQKTLAQRLASHKSKTSKQSKSKKSKYKSGSPAAASSTSHEEPQKNNLDDEEKPLVVPLQCYLRPGNIIGGSFNRTGTGRLLRYVIKYWQRRVQVTRHKLSFAVHAVAAGRSLLSVMSIHGPCWFPEKSCRGASVFHVLKNCSETLVSCNTAPPVSQP